MKLYVERMYKESAELDERIVGAQKAVADQSIPMDNTDRALLVEQLRGMETYQNILKARIRIAELKGDGV